MNHQEKPAEEEEEEEEEESKPLRIEDIFTSDFKVQDDIKRVEGVCEFLIFINRQKVDLEEYRTLRQAQLKNQDSIDHVPVNGARLQDKGKGISIPNIEPASCSTSSRCNAASSSSTRKNKHPNTKDQTSSRQIYGTRLQDKGKRISTPNTEPATCTTSSWCNVESSSSTRKNQHPNTKDQTSSRQINGTRLQDKGKGISIPNTKPATCSRSLWSVASSSKKNQHPNTKDQTSSRQFNGIILQNSGKRIRTTDPQSSRQVNGDDDDDSRVAQNQQEVPPQFEVPLQQRIPSVGCLNGNIGECCRHPFAKPLTKTDIDKNQMRLLMSKPFVEASLLPMLIAGESIKQGIPVTVYDSEGREFEMIFKIWAGKSYILTSEGWNKLCTTHKLKEGDVIQVWMFRHANTGKLCFVLTYTRKGELKKKSRVE